MQKMRHLCDETQDLDRIKPDLMKYVYILDLYFESIHPIVPKIIEMTKNVFHLRMVSSAALLPLLANAVNSTKPWSCCTVTDCKLLLLHILSCFKGTDKCVF